MLFRSSHAEVLGPAERLPDVVDAIGAREHHVTDTVVREERQLVGEEGAVEQRDDGFRARDRQRPEPRALAAGQDDGLRGYFGAQGSASLMSITGMPSRIG